jgi:nonspecific dipeptidase
LPDIQKMMEYAANFIQRLGGQWELRDNPDGTSERPLPPLLLGHFPVDPRKKTVCVYGHLDVQPAHIDDGWDSEPFVLTERDGKLFGRGSTDDKGPALSWLWVIEAHKELGIDLPVNIKILYEGMEEYGSEGLFTFIRDEHDKFLGDVDFFCISDNYWIGKSKPCLTYGLRGLAYFELIVQGCEQDLHSGNMGGAVHEAMTDLIRLMGTLVDSQGRILIEGVMDDVKPVTPEEEAFYDPIEFDVESFKEEAKVKSISNKLLHGNKKDLLMARWRFPTLSLHGIEGAFSGSGAKTVIPAKVKGKFSMRLVPDQDPVRIEQVVRAHIAREFEKVCMLICVCGLFAGRSVSHAY